MPAGKSDGTDWKARLKSLGLSRVRRAAAGPPARGTPAPPGPDSTTGRGREGEDAAARHLEAHGAVVLARNYRARGGEIDLVARHGETLLFVEVKRRRSAARGAPAEAVTPLKRRRIVAAARRFLAETEGFARLVRFDVVAVQDEPRSIDWIQGAFDAD